MRLIDADKLQFRLGSTEDGAPFPYLRDEDVADAPTVDVIPGRWIPVEEKLPEPYKMVLATTGGRAMMVVVLHEQMGWWIEFWSGTQVRKVTHWMPLPEPPGKETR